MGESFVHLKSCYLFYTFVVLSLALSMLKGKAPFPLDLIWRCYFYIAVGVAVTMFLAVYWNYRVRQIKPSQAVFSFLPDKKDAEE